MSTEKGGINFKDGSGEYRWSEDHPWIKAHEHRRVLVASHFTAHEGQSVHLSGLGRVAVCRVAKFDAELRRGRCLGEEPGA